MLHEPFQFMGKITHMAKKIPDLKCICPCGCPGWGALSPLLTHFTITFTRLTFRLISCQAACRPGSRDSRQKRLVWLPTLLHKQLV
jgi:hypothetical protein